MLKIQWQKTKKGGEEMKIVGVAACTSG
ncbi:PTS fructose transporter subunit IIB, partial [Listeria monocytogenes]|nr:PTS fructose transporter subunit IIB [Listeria monocytogenes]